MRKLFLIFSPLTWEKGNYDIILVFGHFGVDWALWYCTARSVRTSEVNSGRGGFRWNILRKNDHVASERTERVMREERFSGRSGQDPGIKWGWNQWMWLLWRQGDESYTHVIVTTGRRGKVDPVEVKATCHKGTEWLILYLEWGGEIRSFRKSS